MALNFAVTGVAGYIAPRHLRAIRDTGNRLVAAADPQDSVGLLDQFGYDVSFFPEIERFDRHLEKLRRGPQAERVHYLSVCSPNYLHDAHCRMGLRVGANVICEKPLVINPWNLEPLQELEHETGQRINTVLQLRLHPRLVELRQRLLAARTDRQHEVCLTYVTTRGAWYHSSWKGSVEKSGGIATNIGIHLFDLLIWLFGPAGECRVHHSDSRRLAGFVELEQARVRWLLSLDGADLPFPAVPGQSSSYRSITVDDQQIELSQGFDDLHTRVYERVLAGEGFGIDDARPAIVLAHQIRTAPVSAAGDTAHPALAASRPATSLPPRQAQPAFFAHPSAFVDPPVEIGAGTRIWHFCHVMSGARIGAGCVLGQNVMVAGQVVIGDNVKIQNNVSVYAGVELEDDVFCGPACVFTNVANPRSQIRRHEPYQRTLVRRGATIGANATIVCGSTIGRYAFIGAGATVRGDVPDYALMLGVPARQAGWMSRHGRRLGRPDSAGLMTCPESGWRYQETVPGILRCVDWPEDRPLASA